MARNSFLVPGSPPGYDTLGQYRAVLGALSATGSIGAGASGILADLTFGPTNPNLLATVTRLAMLTELSAAIAVQKVMDAQAFIYRGVTGVAAGTGKSTVGTTASSISKMRGSHLQSQWNLGSNGELTTIGAIGGSSALTTLTAPTGKTNDATPIGVASWGSIFASTATGTATAAPIGAAVSPQTWVDLFVLQPGVNHPITLAANEGLEIQTITAPGAALALNQFILLEWAEILPA